MKQRLRILGKCAPLFHRNKNISRKPVPVETSNFPDDPEGQHEGPDLGVCGKTSRLAAGLQLLRQPPIIRKHNRRELRRRSDPFPILDSIEGVVGMERGPCC